MAVRSCGENPTPNQPEHCRHYQSYEVSLGVHHPRTITLISPHLFILQFRNENHIQFTWNEGPWPIYGHILLLHLFKFGLNIHNYPLIHSEYGSDLMVCHFSGEMNETLASFSKTFYPSSTSNHRIIIPSHLKVTGFKPFYLFLSIYHLASISKKETKPL